MGKAPRALGHGAPCGIPCPATYGLRGWGLPEPRCSGKRSPWWHLAASQCCACLWREQVTAEGKLPVGRGKRTSAWKRPRCRQHDCAIPRGAGHQRHPVPLQRPSLRPGEGGPGAPTLAGDDGEHAIDRDQELLRLRVNPQAVQQDGGDRAVTWHLGRWVLCQRCLARGKKPRVTSRTWAHGTGAGRCAPSLAGAGAGGSAPTSGGESLALLAWSTSPQVSPTLQPPAKLAREQRRAARAGPQGSAGTGTTRRSPRLTG